MLIVMSVGFILLFSILAMVVYASFNNSYLLYSQTASILKYSYNIQDKVPIFINVYLLNINNMLKGIPLR